MGSFHWEVQRRFRKASLCFDGHEFIAVDGFSDFFNEQIVPLLQTYIDNLDMTTWAVSLECLRLLREQYPHVFNPLSSLPPAPSASDDSAYSDNVKPNSESTDSDSSDNDESNSETEKALAHEKPDFDDSSCDSNNPSDDHPEVNSEKSEGDSNKSGGSFEDFDSPSTFSPDGDAAASSVDSLDDSSKLSSAISGGVGEIPDIDFTQVVQAVLQKLIDRADSRNSVGPHFDIELDIMDSCFKQQGDSDWGKAIYDYILKEYNLLIQRA
jgi:hypothetical protein